MFDLANRTALVTGAASGLGRAFALKLAARGATLACVDIDPAVSDTVSAITLHGGRASAFVADLTQPGSVLITGIDSQEILDQALTAVKTFKPMTDAQVQELLSRTEQAASEGRFELFKTTPHFDSTAANPKWLG